MRNMIWSSVLLLALAVVNPVQADTLQDALASAYANNPSLKAARAKLRSVDERVPQALSGWRPRVTAILEGGRTYTGTDRSDSYRNNANIALSVQQNLFNGFRTVNSTKQAKAMVRAERASLQAAEQDILQAAARAYMDVIRDTALVSLQRSALGFLSAQVGAAKDRFDVGEGTRTDMAQADARRAGAEANLNAALARLNASRAVYKQIIGVEARRLSAKAAFRSLIPRSLDEALAQSEKHQPLIRQSLEMVKAGRYNVKVITGEMLPTVSVEGKVSRGWTYSRGQSNQVDNASIMGRVSIPLYQGGLVSSRVRQAKEDLGQAQLQLDVVRAQVRANVVAAWGNYRASSASITAAEASVRAQQLALDGIIEEQKVGQRTTLAVLDAQRELVTQRSNLVSAQRDKIVSGYQLLAATGRLGADTLKLQVKIYDPTVHYEKVRGKWFGLGEPVRD